MEKNRDLGSGINILDHISEILVTIFWVNPDPGSGAFFSLDHGSKMENFEIGINIPDP